MFEDHKKRFSIEYAQEVMKSIKLEDITLDDHKKIYEILLQRSPKQDHKKDRAEYYYLLAKYAYFLVDISLFEEMEEIVEENLGYEIWHTGYLLLNNRIKEANQHLNKLKISLNNNFDDLICLDYIFIKMRLLSRTREFSKLADYYQSKKNVIMDTGSPHSFTKIGIKYLIAFAYYSIGQSDKSSKIIEKLITKTTDNFDPYFKARLVSLQGRIAKTSGDIETARIRYYEALQIAERANIQAEVALQLKMLGILENSKGNFQKAYQYTEQAEKLYTGLNHTAQIANLKYNRALLLLKLSKYDEAKNTLHQAMAMYRNVKKYIAITRCYSVLGGVSEDQGQLNEAIIYYSKGLQLAEQYKYSEVQFNLLNNIGSLYRIKGDYVTANQFYKKLIKKIERNDVVVTNLSLYYLNYAELQLLLGEYKNAMDIVNNKVSVELNNYELLAYRDYLKSRLFFYRGDIPKAKKAAQNTLKSFKKTKSPHNIATGYKQVAKMNYIMSEDEQAIRKLKKAKSILEKADAYGDLYQTVCLNLIEVYINIYQLETARNEIRTILQLQNNDVAVVSQFRKYQTIFLQLLLQKMEGDINYSRIFEFNKRLKDTDFFSLKMKVLLLLIENKLTNQQTDQALELVEMGISLSIQKKNLPLQLEFSFLKSLVLAKKKRYHEAINLCSKCSDLIKTQSLTIYQNRQAEIIQRIEKQKQFDTMYSTLDMEQLKKKDSKKEELELQQGVVQYLQHIMRIIEEPNLKEKPIMT